MRIISEKTLLHTSDTDRREMTLESIKELEEQYERGEVETPAYFIKKRALIKML